MELYTIIFYITSLIVSLLIVSHLNDFISTMKQIRRIRKFNVIGIIANLILVVIPFFKAIQLFINQYNKNFFIAGYFGVCSLFYISLLTWSVKNFRNKNRQPFTNFLIKKGINLDSVIFYLFNATIVLFIWLSFYKPPLNYEFAISSHNTRNFIGKPQFDQDVLYELSLINNTNASADVYVTTLYSPFYNKIFATDKEKKRQNPFYKTKKDAPRLSLYSKLHNKIFRVDKRGQYSFSETEMHTPCVAVYLNRGFVPTKSTEKITLLQGKAPIPNLLSHPANVELSDVAFTCFEDDFFSKVPLRNALSNITNLSKSGTVEIPPNFFLKKTSFQFRLRWKTIIRIVAGGKSATYLLSGDLGHNPHLLVRGNDEMYLTTGWFYDYISFDPYYQFNDKEIRHIYTKSFRTIFEDIPYISHFGFQDSTIKPYKNPDRIQNIITI